MAEPSRRPTRETRRRLSRALAASLTAALVLGPAAALGAESTNDPTPITDHLQIRALRDDVWVATSTLPWPANSLVVRMQDGTVFLADTPPTSAFTRDLLAWIESTLHPRRLVAMNSHFHVDAAGGNAVLREVGAEIWASEATRELLLEKGEGMLETLRADYEGLFDDEVVGLPIATFDPAEGKILRFGDQEVRLFFPGASHTPDLVVAYFPDLGVLFGGCMIKVGSFLGYLGGADLETWPGALEALRDLDFDYLVPGHGSQFSPDLLDNTLRLIEDHLASSDQDSD